MLKIANTEENRAKFKEAMGLKHKIVIEPKKKKKKKYETMISQWSRGQLNMARKKK